MRQVWDKLVSCFKRCWRFVRKVRPKLVSYMGNFLMIAGWSIFILFFYCGVNCIWYDKCPKRRICKIIPTEKNNRVDAAKITLALLGGGLALVGLGIAFRRLQKADKQLFLQDLHQGINMLYSKDNHERQLGSVARLHSLAKANKHNTERREEILDNFCLFLRNAELKLNKEGVVKDDTFNLTNEILRVICRPETSKNIYPSNKINLKDTKLWETTLRNAQLQGAQLQGSDLTKVDLLWANLYGADLRFAHFSRTDLRGADLRGVHLEASVSEELPIQSADLSYALVDISHEGYMCGFDAKDVIWVKEKKSDKPFKWRGTELTKQELIDKVGRLKFWLKYI